jgi:hypothetical protein
MVWGYGLILLPQVFSSFALVPSNGVFGCFDLAALRGCQTFNVCLLFV